MFDPAPFDGNADRIARLIEQTSPACGAAARQLAEMVHVLGRANMLASTPGIIVVESEDARAKLFDSFKKGENTPMPTPGRAKPAQFLAFAGADYYPNGGWSDLLGAFATADEASAACRAKLAEESRWDWWHVVDLQTMAIVGGAERS